MTFSAELLRVLSNRVLTLLESDRRVLLGLAGAPGSGKSTLALALAQRLGEDLGADHGDQFVAMVPMDGFHLADQELTRLGRLGQKGAPDTFDVAGYLALLRRIVADDEEVVYAPGFDRGLEQPIAGSIPVPGSSRLVITEGNYLLGDGAWAGVRDLLTQTWFIETDEDLRRGRLVARHQQYGKPADLAESWAHGNDQRNAETVAATRDRADLIVFVPKPDAVVSRPISPARVSEPNTNRTG